VFAAVEIVDDSLLVAFSQHSQDEPSSIVSAFVYVGDDKAETLLVIVVD